MTAALPAHGDIRIAVIGLGYVGLPLAAAFGRRYPTVGFDIDAQRIAQLHENHDHPLELSADELKAAGKLEFASDPQALAGCNVFIVTGPTTLDDYNRPEPRPPESARLTVGLARAPAGAATKDATAPPCPTQRSRA